MSHPATRCSDDVDAARWVIAHLAADSYRVDMLLPPDYPAYIRLLHPIVADTREGRRLIRWSELADRAGLGAIDRRVQSATLLSRAGVDSAEPPQQGELPEEQLTALAQILAAHTSTNDHCWFCVWEGYGAPVEAVDPDRDRQALFARGAPPSAPGRTRSPGEDRKRCANLEGPLQRRYLLYQGQLEAVTALGLPASLWWPEDRAWCVATDVDLDSTYIAASDALARALLQSSDLEALPAELNDGITQAADRSPGAPR